MTESRTAQIRATFAALTRGDLEPAAALLSPDVVWQGMNPGPSNCLNRREVLAVLLNRHAHGHIGELVDVIELDAASVAVMMRDVEDSQESVDVLTFDRDRVVAIQTCANRDAAYALAAKRPPSDRGAEPGLAAGDRQRPHGLVPFVHVHDVARSVRFYETLGFDVIGTHEHDGRLDWASLRSGDAQLMLAAGHEIEPAVQGVLFYLFSPDIAGLRETLLRAGIAVTPIADGSPGPEQEMRVVDPDGYCLMIAQAES
jgi:ketosteroid isomerase-like protein